MIGNINQLNQVNQMQQNKQNLYRSVPNVLIAYVNNKDEAMMFNVLKGYTAYLFEYNRPVFYMKDCDCVSGQISFFEYEYNEVVPQPVPDPSSFVTRNDMVNFKDDIMQSIAALLSDKKEVVNDEQCISKTDAKSARPVKSQSR